MNSRFFILIAISVLLFLSPVTSSARDDSVLASKVSAALDVVGRFYKELASEDPTYPEMFDMRLTSPGDMNSRELWEYFRRNRHFFFPESVIRDNTLDTYYERVSVSVMLINVREDALESAGMWVVVRQVLEPVNSGILRLIIIPVLWPRGADSPLIGCSGISINGVLLDPYNTYTMNRNYDLFKRLGFGIEDDRQARSRDDVGKASRFRWFRWRR